MKLQKQIGFEFEIGSPISGRRICNKIKEELGIEGLKSVQEYTVDTKLLHNGEITTPVWPFRKGMVNLRKIFRWFEKNGILTDDTCGLHVNLSYKKKEFNYMIDPMRLVLCFNEEKWLRACNRQRNTYTGCYIDELIVDSRRKMFDNEEKVYEWIDKRLDLLKDKYRTVNIERLETNNPYIEYRCLGGRGYHLRPNIMFKAIIDMSNNMDRALPFAPGTGFMTKKVRECFARRDDHRKFVPH